MHTVAAPALAVLYAHGVLRLDLQAGAYSWQFIPVAGDTFSDFRLKQLPLEPGWAPA